MLVETAIASAESLQPQLFTPAEIVAHTYF